MSGIARTSELLRRAGFAHGFFTRIGGVSEGPYASLNTAASTGDDPDRVRQNVARIAEALGVAHQRLFYPSQVHGTETAVVSGSLDPATVLGVRADATLALDPGIGCAVRSADCGTVLVGDPSSGAAVAIHAGWRGTVAGVIGAAIDELAARTGCDRAGLVAAIGPHIERCCFEVGSDVAAEIAAASSAGATVVHEQNGAKPHVDLRAVMRAQLVASGLGDASIDDVFGCTVCDAASFFSYRRDGARSGRLLSAIVTRSR